MKRILLAVMIAISLCLCAVLSACGGDDNSGDNGTGSNTTSQSNKGEGGAGGNVTSQSNKDEDDTGSVPDDGANESVPGDSAGESVSSDNTDESKPSEDVDKKEYHIVTFITNNGTVIEPVQVEDGGKVAQPQTLEKVGYVFSGWYLGEEKWSFDCAIAKDITLEAKWISSNNTLSFDGNGAINGAMDSLLLESDKSITLPKNLFFKRGYTFIGWATAPNGEVEYTNEAEYVMGTEGPYILYAVWQANGNALVLNGNGATGEMADVIIRTDETVTLPLNTYVMDGYTFAGWANSSYGLVKYADGADYTMGTDETYTLYAIWKPNKNALVFDGNGATGGEMENMTIMSNLKANLTVNAFVRDGYRFVGWSTTPDGEVEYTDGVKYTMGTEASYTLYAIWEANDNNIIFDPNGATSGSTAGINAKTDERVTLTLNGFIRDGYTFMGWTTTPYGIVQYVNGDEYTVGAEASYTLYAVWQAIENTLVLNGNGAEGKMADVKIKTDVTATLPKATYTKLGYTFKGWATTPDGEVEYTNGARYVMGTNNTYTLYAVWEIKSNSLYFNATGGEGDMSPLTVNSFEKTTLPVNNFTRKNYTFLGWSTTRGGEVEYTDGAEYTMGPNSSYQLYAVWELTRYTITYYKNGGTGDLKETFTSKDLPLTLKDLDNKRNYLFNYWYKESDFSGEPVLKITEIGNVTLYAEYVECTDGLKLSATNNGYVVYGYTGTATEVVIPRSYKGKKITSISNYAFSDCTDLTSITIPDGVTSIGGSAFNGCSSLAEVHISDMETWCGISFGDSSANPLSYAKNLYLNGELITELIIPEGITSIGKYAFSGYTSLTSATIGNSVTSIDYSAFYSCENLTSVEISDGVTSIGESAFEYCENLTNVKIGNGVTSIGKSAFAHCYALTSIIIPDNVTSIGNRAFFHCESITIYCEVSSQPSGYASESWNESHFAYHYYPVVWDCNNNEVADNGYIYTVINGVRYGIKNNVASVVEQPKNIKSITIPKSITYNDVVYDVTRIGSYAFCECTHLTSITIPKSITSIGSYAFSDCTCLIIYCEAKSGDSSSWKSSSVPVVWDCNNNEVAEDGCIYATIDGIRYALKDGEATVAGQPINIANVNIPSSVIYKGEAYDVTSIGKYAFYHCKNLTSITIPESVTSIGDYAFYNCSNLTSMTIPESVTSIGKYAFWYCSSLTSITISDSVTSLDGDVFYGCSRLVYNQYNNGCYLGNEENPYVALVEVKNINITNFEINQNTKIICGSAFSNCSKLTSIEIPNSVVNIGEYTFISCSSLTSITLPFVGATLGGTENTHFGYIFGASSPDYNDDRVPTSLTEVIITGGNNISDSAFSGCTSLTSVTIPNSVTSIGKGAFSGCTSLTSVTISDSVTSIGSYAFSGCTSLTNMTIPESVTSIGNGAFYNCTSLTSVTIGNGVTSIGSDAFYGCTSLTNMTIPESVTSIGDYAFKNCTSLTSITIPNSVTSIGNYAFSGCTSLVYNQYNNGCYLGNAENPYVVLVDVIVTTITDFEINQNTRVIYYCAFENCESLTNIEIPDCVASIGGYAFWDCKSLTSVTIGNSVTSIGNYAFKGCSSLTSITIPDSVTSIGNGAFDSCTRLTSVTIGSGVTSIGYNAFDYCISLTSVTIGSSVTSIGDYAFYLCKSLKEVHISDIGAWCGISFSDYYDNYYANPLYYAKNLYLNGELVTELVIPEGVTSIGKYTFYGCSSLTSITIPNSVTSIGEDAFVGCSSLAEVHISDIGAWCGISFGSGSANPLYYAKNLYLNGELVTELVIPEGVTSIDKYAFEGCTSLTSVTIGKGVTRIGSDAFDGCKNLKEVQISDIGAWCGISFSTSNANPLCYAKSLYLNGELVTELVIPESVTSIGKYAFMNCTSLTSVTIPNSVTSIGNYAFSGCTRLKSIIIPNSVTNIGNYAFSGCTLTSITIPGSVTSIGKYAFWYCNSLTSITIPFVGETLDGTANTHFGYIFGASSYIDNDDYVSTSLEEVIITGGNSIGNGAFYNCTSLTSITIPNSVTSIGERAFRDCTSLTRVTIPDSVTSIGSNAFSGCTSLTNVTIGNSVTSIGSAAFDGCTSLTNMTIPESVTSIGDSAFSGCTSLVYNQYNNGYYLGNEENPYAVLVKTKNKNMTNFEINEKTRIICSSAFSSCESLTNITIPNSVTSIGSYAFRGCTSLTSITIPDSVTSIGSYAFSGCTSLTSITIPNSVTRIGYNAFSGCTSLTSITIPDSVTSIGGSAFYDCTILTIYCEATSKPSGWDSDWNYSKCPVVWGYKQED